MVQKLLPKIKEWGWFRKLRIYGGMTDLYSISRRYFVIGFFDGVLTVMGMILGAHLSGEASRELIISAGIATSLALGISSGWGAFEAERVEQKILASEKRRALLKAENEQCLIDDAHEFTMKVGSFVHAIAPIPAGMIPLIPYLFFKESTAFLIAIPLGLIMLFLVGLSMGRVARENILKSGVRMALAGLVTLLIVTVLSPSHL